MAIEFYCSECGAMLRVADSNRGKMARCPRCQMINPIPADADGSELERVSPDTGPTGPVYQKSPAAEDRWSMRSVDGTEYGPVRFDELQRWYQEGRINEQCMVQRFGENRWRPAMDVLGAAEKATAYSPKPIEYTSSVQSANRPFAPHSGTVVLVLACFGIFFFPCAVAAVIMGHSELNRMKRGEVDPSGESQVRAGYVLGWVFLIIGVLPWVCCCLFPVFDAL